MTFLKKYINVRWVIIYGLLGDLSKKFVKLSVFIIANVRLLPKNMLLEHNLGNSFSAALFNIFMLVMILSMLVFFYYYGLKAMFQPITSLGEWL